METPQWNPNPVKKEMHQLKPEITKKLKVCLDPDNVMLNVKCKADDFYKC